MTEIFYAIKMKNKNVYLSAADPFRESFGWSSKEESLSFQTEAQAVAFAENYIASNHLGFIDWEVVEVEFMFS